MNLMGKLTISMAIFNSYVSLPEGTHILTLIVASTVRMKPLLCFVVLLLAQKQPTDPEGKEQLVRFKCSLMKL